MNSLPRPRLAVIGAGISGLSMAWLARHTHDVTLFEADGRAGGHADTQLVDVAGQPVAVDTGFIVYNVKNYPNLIGLFAALNIATKPTDMSFGVSIADGRMEYAGGELSQMFAQKSNLVRPRFWAMVSDILRFYRSAPALLAADPGVSLGEWLDRNRYSQAFIEDHILPMGAAIWSASVTAMRDFPVRHFARFFQNHGLLQLTDRPAWRTVDGGSRHYVAAVLSQLQDVRLGRAVRSISRDNEGVTIHAEGGPDERFDAAVLACHADQSLALLDQPTWAETQILGKFRCQDNVAILHTDASLMPKRRAVWSSWNYLSNGRHDHAQEVSVTYWMNRLQSLETKLPLLVSLNPLLPPDPKSVLATRNYRHPMFDAAAMQAQDELGSLQGADRLYFAGAWTGWGFHEDGIASAVRVGKLLGITPPWDTANREAAERAAA